MDAGFQIFHIFYAKKRPCFSILGPPLFSGRRPEIFFFGIFVIFCNYAKKYNSGLRPENRGVPKAKNKVVFWHKKCEKFGIRHPIFFSQYFFNLPMRPKRHFVLKDTFSIETIVTKKQTTEKTQNFPKFPKIC